MVSGKRRPYSVQNQSLSLVRQGRFGVVNMKKIIVAFALMMLVLFTSPIMAQESVVVHATGNYIMVASTDILAFAQEVSTILDWIGTLPGVDRFYPLGPVMISTDPITNDPFYVQHFTLFRDLACPQCQ